MRIDIYNQSDRNQEALAKGCGCIILLVLLTGCCIGWRMTKQKSEPKDDPNKKEEQSKKQDNLPKEPKELPKEEKELLKPTRKEFTKSVVGKTKKEVLELLGEPQIKNDYATYSTWRYKNLSRDPSSDKIDILQSLEFRNGKVNKVYYVPGS